MVDVHGWAGTRFDDVLAFEPVAALPPAFREKVMRSPVPFSIVWGYVYRCGMSVVMVIQ